MNLPDPPIIEDLIEAAAMGVPAIVSGQMGAADWVVDGSTGRHVAKASLPELTAALSEASGSQSERWGTAAHQRYWAEPYSLARHVGLLEAVYADCVAL